MINSIENVSVGRYRILGRSGRQARFFRGILPQLPKLESVFDTPTEPVLHNPPMIQIQPREDIPDGYYWLRYADETKRPEVLLVSENRVFQTGFAATETPLDRFLDPLRHLVPPPVLVPIPKPPPHPATV